MRRRCSWTRAKKTVGNCRLKRSSGRSRRAPKRSSCALRRIPLGIAYAENETRALLDIVRKHDCWLIVDEIYAELVYEGFSFVSAAKIAPDLRDRLVVVDGVSKTYAMTGWRIGWAIAPAPLVKALDTVQGQSTTNATAVAQHAAVAALRTPLEDFAAIRSTFQKRRDAMVAGLGSVPGIRCRKPEGAFYAFADCRGLYGLDWNGKALATDEDIAFWLLDRAHVAAVPGGAFGAPGFHSVQLRSERRAYRSRRRRDSASRRRSATRRGSARANRRCSLEAAFPWP